MRKSRSSREQQANFNEKELRRTKPAATLSLNVARYATEAKQHSPLGELCICTNILLHRVTNFLVIDARRFAPRRGDSTRRPRAVRAPLMSNDLLTAGATGTILKL
jgi:hypothetical protein